MIIKVKYRAIQWDNHQGGSGRPYNSELLYNEDEYLTLDEMYNNALDQLADLGRDTWIGEVRLISISIIKDN